MNRTKDLFGNTVLAGFESVEAAQAEIERLRATYKHGYGFYLGAVHPSQTKAAHGVAADPDGTFSFRYHLGATCD